MVWLVVIGVWAAAIAFVAWTFRVVAGRPVPTPPTRRGTIEQNGREG